MTHYVSTKHALKDKLPQIDGLHICIQQDELLIKAVYVTHDYYTVHAEPLTDEEASSFILGTFDTDLYDYIYNAVRDRVDVLTDLGLIEDADPKESL